MKVLREHNVGWKYLNALAAIDGVTVERCTDDLPADAPGTDIAEFAQRESYVILTRDEDFFALDPDCGILFLAPNRAPQPSGVRRAVERIIEAYADDGDVREPVPVGGSGIPCSRTSQADLRAGDRAIVVGPAHAGVPPTRGNSSRAAPSTLPSVQTGRAVPSTVPSRRDGTAPSLPRS